LIVVREDFWRDGTPGTIGDTWDARDDIDARMHVTYKAEITE
jgi:hypothetical protein